MRRTLVSLEFKAKWWESRAEVEQFQEAHAEGVRAYAHEQAAVWRSLKTRFQTVWGLNEDSSFSPPDNAATFSKLYTSSTGHGEVDGDSDSEVENDWEEIGIVVDSAEGQGKDKEGQEAEEEEENEIGRELDLEVLAHAGKYAEDPDF